MLGQTDQVAMSLYADCRTTTVRGSLFESVSKRGRAGVYSDHSCNTFTRLNTKIASGQPKRRDDDYEVSVVYYLSSGRHYIRWYVMVLWWCSGGVSRVLLAPFSIIFMSREVDTTVCRVLSGLVDQ